MAINLDLTHRLPDGKPLLSRLSDLIENLDDQDRDTLIQLWGSYIDHVANEFVKLYHFNLSKSIETIPELLRTRWVPITLDSAPEEAGETARGGTDRSVAILLWLVENIISQERRFERGVDYTVDDTTVKWFTSDPPNRFFNSDVSISSQTTTFTVTDNEIVTDLTISFSPDPGATKIFLRSPKGTSVLAFSNDPADTTNLEDIVGELSPGTWEIIKEDPKAGPSYSGTATVKLYKSITLWAEFAYIDDNRLFNNFGTSIEFQRTSSELYKEQLLAIFNAFWNGPAIQLLRQGVNAILTLPRTEEDGTIVSISPDTSIILVLDGSTSVTDDILSSGDSTVTLWSGAPAANIFVMYPEKFTKIDFDVTTPAVGSGSLIAEFFDGDDFISLSGIVDGTEFGGDSLSQDGKVTFFEPGNWVIGGPPNLNLPDDKFIVRLRPTTDPSTDPVVDKINVENEVSPLTNIAVVVVLDSGETINVPDVLTKTIDEKITFDPLALDSADVKVTVSKRGVIENTIVVTDSPETKTYVDGTDYTVDLETGEITLLNGFAIDTDDISEILVDYQSIGPFAIVGSFLKRFSPLTAAVLIEDRISDTTYLDDPIFDIAIEQFIETTTLTKAQVKELLRGNLFVVNIDTAISSILGPTGFNVEDIGKFVISLKPAHTAFFIRFGDTLIGVDLSVLSLLDVTSLLGTLFDYTNRLKTDSDFEDAQAKFTVFDGTTDITSDVEFSGDSAVSVWASSTSLFIGSKLKFPKVNVDVTTAAIGSGTLIAKYFDGAAFSALTVLYDETDTGDSFAIDGQIKFTAPTDWAVGADAVESQLPSDLFFIELTPTSTPGTLPVVDRIHGVDFLTYSGKVTDEVIATGNGALTSFGPFTLDRPPVTPFTVLVNSIDTSDVALFLSDDGAGALAGTGTGSITYSSGSISVTFDTAVKSGEDIKVTYVDDSTSLYKQFSLDDDSITMAAEIVTKENEDVDTGLIDITGILDVTSFFEPSFVSGKAVFLSSLNEVSIVDESIAFSSSALDLANVIVQAANKNIVETSLVITDDPSTKTYVEGSDYTVDYAKGEITLLKGGDIDVDDISALLIDYEYVENLDITKKILDAGDGTAAVWAAGNNLYIGHTTKFEKVNVDLITASVGVTTTTAEFWDGSAWSSLAITDGTSNLTVDGQITFTEPATWAISPGGLPTSRFFIRLIPDATPGTLPVIDQIDVEDSVGALLSSIKIYSTEKIGSYIFRLHNNYIDALDGDDTNITDKLVESDSNSATVWSGTPANPFYVGMTHLFSKITVELDTAASGSGALVAEYWDGSSFVSLSGVTDGTESSGDSLGKDGDITWTVPTDWIRGGPASTNLSANRFYVKLSPTTDPTTDPEVEKILVEDNFRLANGFSTDPFDAVTELEENPDSGRFTFDSDAVIISDEVEIREIET